ncbi:MAG TPA: triose-phosphate isomerase [Methylomirabilota bacterium]|jgi:triosephosphate isomerase|nr:triose-phosphate isomerase [Methylomirabilota bacterium]
MASRLPLIAGNWKMYGTRLEAIPLLSALKERLARAQLSDREVVVAPPFTVLETAAHLLIGSSIRLAAQNLHWEPQGAFTGEVSGPMLKELGCSYVIIGHSERRQYFGETDEQIAKKVSAAQQHGLTPIVCVGETLAERENGSTLAVITRQVREALYNQDKTAIASFVIAYEPVWAIGTGCTATPTQAQEVHAAIRTLLVDIAGQEAAAAVRLLYGGSVKPDNIDGLMAQTDIDGVLVGGASLQADAFARIVSFQ